MYVWEWMYDLFCNFENVLLNSLSVSKNVVLFKWFVWTIDCDRLFKLFFFSYFFIFTLRVKEEKCGEIMSFVLFCFQT